MDLIKQLKPEYQFLCCALVADEVYQRKELLSLWHETGDEAAWNCARSNRAESIVGLALRKVMPAEELPERWRQAITAAEAKISQFMAELDRVAAALAAEGIPMVALKNSGIARGIFTERAGSPMGDVDVLVNPRDFRRAHACMVKLGYNLDSRSPLEVEGLDEAERQGGAEYTYTLPDGSTFWFELQWRPVAGRWIQPEQEPKAEDLLARSVAIAGTVARLLAPEDNLMQVCLHTAKHTYIRAPGFRLHTDVDRIVRRCTVDWDVFVKRVESARVRTVVYFSLEIPHQLLRTPIPDWVLRRLQPAAWKRRLMLGWLCRVGLFNPDQRKWSKLGYVLFNLNLYDSWQGICRGIAPDASWMCRRYQVRHRWTLPWWYLVRIWDLLLKRAHT